VALYLGVVLLALVQAVGFGEPRRTLVAALPALVAAAVVVAARWHRADVDEGRGRRWLLGLAGAQVALATVAIVGLLVALPAAFRGDAGFYDVKVRVVTPLGAHNTVGGLLLVGVVATAVLAQDDRRWWAGTVVTTLGVVASLSRGAALVLLVAGLTSRLLGTRRRVAVAVTVAGVVALVVVSLLAATLARDPDPSRPPSEGVVGESITDRLYLVERGLELLVEEPLLGVGLGGFGERVAEVPFPSHHAHNTVAHAGAEGGVPYAAIVVGLSVLLLVRAWRQPPGWRREVGLVGGGALLLHGQLDVLAGLLGYEVLLAVLLVLTAGPVRRRG
jgi:O-antigen ligase